MSEKAPLPTTVNPAEIVQDDAHRLDEASVALLGIREWYHQTRLDKAEDSLEDINVKNIKYSHYAEQAFVTRSFNSPKTPDHLNPQGFLERRRAAKIERKAAKHHRLEFDLATRHGAYSKKKEESLSPTEEARIKKIEAKKPYQRSPEENALLMQKKQRSRNAPLDPRPTNNTRRALKLERKAHNIERSVHSNKGPLFGESHTRSLEKRISKSRHRLDEIDLLRIKKEVVDSDEAVAKSEKSAGRTEGRLKHSQRIAAAQEKRQDRLSEMQSDLEEYEPTDRAQAAAKRVVRRYYQARAVGQRVDRAIESRIRARQARTMERRQAAHDQATKRAKDTRKFFGL